MRFYQRGKRGTWWVERDDGSRHSLGTPDSREKERAFAEIIAKEREARKPSVTVGEVWNEYVKTLAGRPAAERAAHAWKALEATFGKNVSARVTERDTRAYAAARARSDATVLTELVFLRTALNYGARKGLIDRNYEVWVPPPPPPRDRRLTKEQAVRLLAVEMMPHVKLFILLAMNTAGRKQAILELTWDRVDFERNHVQLSIPGRRGKGRATVPMNGTLRAALAEAKEYAFTPYVIEWAGQRVRHIEAGFNRVADAAGLPWVTPHTLRHSVACWQIEAGVPLERVAQFLGHQDIATTFRVYARLSTHGMQADADVLELGTPAGRMRRVK